MRILVTGAAGCIGTNLCLSLLAKKHEVVGVDNFQTGSRKNIKMLEKIKGFKFYALDVVDINAKDIRKIGSVSQIYNLACPTGVPNLVPLAFEMLSTCSIGTLNVLEIARKNKAKFLLTSSSEVYGDPKVRPQDENYTGNVDPVGERSSYEEGKRFAESLTAMYVRKYNLDAKIVRIFNTYGPYMSKSDTRIIPRFLGQAISGKPLTVQGRGKQSRTYCYVDDLVAGLQVVMKNGKRGEVYNIGSNIELTVLELAKLIIKITNSKSNISFVERPAHDHQSRMPNLSKIKKIGWMPKVSHIDGLEKSLQWYKLP